MRSLHVLVDLVSPVLSRTDETIAPRFDNLLTLKQFEMLLELSPTGCIFRRVADENPRRLALPSAHRVLPVPCPRCLGASALVPRSAVARSRCAHPST